MQRKKKKGNRRTALPKRPRGGRNNVSVATRNIRYAWPVSLCSENAGVAGVGDSIHPRNAIKMKCHKNETYHDARQLYTWCLILKVREAAKQRNGIRRTTCPLYHDSSLSNLTQVLVLDARMMLPSLDT